MGAKLTCPIFLVFVLGFVLMPISNAAQWNIDFQGDGNHNNTSAQTDPVDYNEPGVCWNIFEVPALSAPWPGPTNYATNPSMDLADDEGNVGVGKFSLVKFSIVGDAYGWAGDAGDDPLTGDYLIILNGFGVTNDPLTWRIVGLAPSTTYRLTYYHRANVFGRGINFVANGVETTVSVPGSSVASALVTTGWGRSITGTADSDGYAEGNWSALTISTVAATATNPHPANGATDVPLDVVLGWSPGDYAVTHDVYFGTSNPPAFIGNLAVNIYYPGTLEPGTNYYWKVDEVEADGTTKHTGEIWRFTTIGSSTKASNPYPADGATDVALDGVVRWTPYLGAVSHDVYFGTSSPPAFIGRTANGYSPGTLEPGTTYYWKINEVVPVIEGPPIIHEGDIWSFTTVKAGESGTTLFSDDFESYTLGTFPLADWEIVWAGTGENYVTDAYSFSSTKSLQLWGRPNWSSVAQRKFSTDATVIGYECAIRIDSIGTGGPGREEAVGFFNRDVYIWGRGYAAVLFNHDDGEIKAEDGTVLGDWEPGVWYHVKVVLDRRTNTYSTWIDHQFKGDGLFTTHSDTELIDALSLMSGHAGVKVYYDDVRVFTVDARPQLLANQDVGNPALAGTVSYDATSDAWTIVGGGNDIGGGSDQFHYVYRPLAGDGEATVRVASMDVTHEWAKGGVMIRETLDGNSEHAMIAMTGTHGVQTVWRQETGGSSADVTTSGVIAPCWIRIERVGDTINTYYSPNGLMWMPQQSLNIPMNETVYIGMGVVSRQSDTLATAIFDNVALTAPEYNLAWGPSPADGRQNMPLDTKLSWMAGSTAVSHDVYFGTDFDAVANADTSDTTGIYRARRDANSYDPGGLEVCRTYYWKIDEVVPTVEGVSIVCKGDVWYFTTADLTPFIVDDFEGYDYFTNRISQIWRDGYGYGYFEFVYPGNGTGSRADINSVAVHEGVQSMKFDYDNTGTAEAYYSQAERTFDVPQDWTSGGVKALSLWFHGDSNNDPEPMYVAVEDSMGMSAVVYHDNLDAARIGTWQQWNINLQEFAGVNPASIRKMYVGVGDRDNPTLGGTGTIYFDDIQLGESTEEPEEEEEECGPTQKELTPPPTPEGYDYAGYDLVVNGSIAGSTLPKDHTLSSEDIIFICGHTIVRDGVTVCDVIVTHVFTPKEEEECGPTQEELTPPPTPEGYVYVGYNVVVNSVLTDYTVPLDRPDSPEDLIFIRSHTIVKDGVTVCDVIVAHVFAPKADKDEKE